MCGFYIPGEREKEGGVYLVWLNNRDNIVLLRGNIVRLQQWQCRHFFWLGGGEIVLEGAHMEFYAHSMASS
jgi:hypothetical protein